MTDFVFLHGGGQGSWVWAETVAALRGQGDGEVGQALALDVPGCGVKRGRDTSAITFEAIVEELTADIDASGAQDAVLVGHSQAGTVLPSLIRARPGLFRRAVYVTCVVPLPGLSGIGFRDEEALEGAAEMRARHGFAEAVADPKERYREMFCNDMTAEAADAFLARLGADGWPMASYHFTDWRYDGLDTVPATYVQCLRDAVLLPQWQGVFATRIGAERIVRIDAAHQVMNARPQALAEVLLDEATQPSPAKAGEG